MKSEKIRTITLTGIFTALILVFTALVKVPSFTGYVHLGDAFIFLAASILPAPYAVFAGAAGAVVADLLAGYATWAPASFVIKTLTVLCFTWKRPTILTKRNLTALVPAAVLCIGGYYLYEAILYGNFASPVYGMVGNLCQVVFSGALYVLVGFALDKARVKEHLLAGRKISK